MVKNIKNPKVEGRHPSIKQHLESTLACVSHTGRIPKGILGFVTNVNHAVFYKAIFAPNMCSGWEWGETLADKIKLL